MSSTKITHEEARSLLRLVVGTGTKLDQYIDQQASESVSRAEQSDMQRIRERLAAERAWDEGYARGALAMPDPVNPYRPQPAKGDGDGE